MKVLLGIHWKDLFTIKCALPGPGLWPGGLEVAGYVLSGKDTALVGLMTVHRTHIDREIWRGTSLSWNWRNIYVSIQHAKSWCCLRTCLSLQLSKSEEEQWAMTFVSVAPKSWGCGRGTEGSLVRRQSLSQPLWLPENGRAWPGLSLWSEGRMNLSPSSHCLRNGAESQQFPPVGRMSGFSEVESCTIMAATTSASPPVGLFCLDISQKLNHPAML